MTEVDQLRKRPLHRFAQKLHSRFAVPCLGYKRFKDFALVINSPPEVVGFTPNLHEHLVQVPLPLRPRAKLLGSFPSDLGCEDRTKTVPPEPNCFVADVDAAFVEQILDIAKRQWKPDIQHHREANDFRRCLEVAERIFHSLTLPGAHRRPKPGSFDNAIAMICGPGGLVTAVSDALLESGLPMDNVVYERFDYAAGASSRQDRRNLRYYILVCGLLGLGVVLFALR